MKKDDGFTARTLMAMADEIQQAEESVRRSRVLFEVLAKDT